MRPLRKLAIGLWVAVFLFAGIRFGTDWLTVESTVNSDADSTDNSQVTATVEKTTPAVHLGDALPALTLNDLKGQPRALAEWSGRTLLINFWATWCAPCRKEMPLLEQFQQHEFALVAFFQDVFQSQFR